MNERLDYLLSIALDDELAPEEREELDQLLAEASDTPEAVDRRASFATINDVVRNIGAQPANRDTELAAGLASIRARLEASASPRVDELAARRRPMPAWIPSLGLVAAAAMAVYFVVPSSSTLTGAPEGSIADLDLMDSQDGTNRPTLDGTRQIDDPIDLAVVFEIDEDSDTVGFIGSMSAADFEVIEQLELLEFLAAREEEGRG